MTVEFTTLLSIVGNFVQGKSPVIDNIGECDWNKVVTLAQQQSVLPLLVYAFKANNMAFPSGINETIIHSAKSATIKNVIQKEGILNLLHQFENEHINAILLKGYAIAREYNMPECRISADADILVDPSDEARAYELLRRNGFTINERARNTHHADCHHPSLGCVELHVALYDEIVENIWFEKMDVNALVTEEFVSVIERGSKYFVLGESDALMFYVLHFIKHFILSGASIRMMLDVVLYYRNHRFTMDLDRFWMVMTNLKYDRLIRTIIQCCIQYCCFEKNELWDNTICEDTTQDAIEAVMDDLEAGGWMGINDKEARENGWYIYNQERILSQRTKTGFAFYMLRWKIKKNWNVLFPNKDYFSRRYPYTRNKAWLIPYAWCHRLFISARGRVGSGTITKSLKITGDSTNLVGEKRADLFRMLGMM